MSDVNGNNNLEEEKEKEEVEEETEVEDEDGNFKIPYEEEPFRSLEATEQEDTESVSSPLFLDLSSDLLGETEAAREEGLAELKVRLAAAVEKEEGERFARVPKRRAFLLKFLRAANFSSDSAFTILSNYLTLRRDLPREYHDPPDPTSGETRRVSGQRHLWLSRGRDRRTGRRVLLSRSGRWRPSLASFRECYTYSYMVSEMLAFEPKTQVAGMTVVADASGFGLEHVQGLSMSDIKNSIKFLQECFPLWWRSYHIVNASYLFQMGYALVRPMLSTQLQETIHFHANLEDLSKHVDPRVLPLSLGGYCPDGDSDFDDLTEEILEKLSEMEPYFRELRQMDGETTD